MMQGKISRYNVDRGFDFIDADDGTSHFVHVTQITDGSVLRVGDRVQFDIGESRGKTCAVRVRQV